MILQQQVAQDVIRQVWTLFPQQTQAVIHEIRALRILQ